jgi:serine phosphatase RsbU (regulator of sigma subunit)
MHAGEQETGSAALVRAFREVLDELRRGGAPETLVQRLAELGGRVEEELRRAREELSVKAFALHGLLDASRDLAGSAAEESVLDAVLTSVMGHFVVSRGAVFRLGPQGLVLAHARGVRRAGESGPMPPAEARAALDGLAPTAAVADLPDGPLRRQLAHGGLALVLPLADGERVIGALAIGERASGRPFSEEDREVAAALARQARAALESARLQRVREEKRRQDRELQVAREIQESLFPPRPPEVPGFEVAGRSRPCFEVGGDSYDWIPLDGDRLAVVVGDVAGKGTPASLVMASVHASVQLLAGIEPARLVERVNRFLSAHAPASRFVTLFYAELDASSRRLRYVNAGHVPPYRVAPDGTVSRLVAGGPALGLLPDASYEAGEVVLRPGDVVAVVTDGVTEAVSSADDEFGDGRVCEELRRLAAGSAAGILDGLVAAVERWTGGGGLGDDMTAVVLRAR